MNKQQFLAIVLVFIAIIAFLHEGAIYFRLYFQVWWFDVLLHFLGGAWIALASLWIYGFSGIAKSPRKDFFSTFAVALLAVFSVGILWELFEVAIGAPLAANPSYDVVKDLIMDALGGLVAHAFFINAVDEIHG
jgi:hypothetical protein